MKLTLNYKYMYGYLPSKRHKKLQYEERQGVITVDIREVSSDEAVLVAEVRSYLNSEGLTPKSQELRRYKSKWWNPVMSYKDRTKLAGIDQLIEELERVYFDYDENSESNSRESIRSNISKKANEYIIVNKILFKQTYEPVWGVVTFGLGNNHGGTGLFITNPGRVREGFNLDNKKGAIEEAYKVAMGRGDTESAKSYKIETYNTYDAKVYKPEYLKKGKKAE